jgi:hypothetical protein
MPGPVGSVPLVDRRQKNSLSIYCLAILRCERARRSWTHMEVLGTELPTTPLAKRKLQQLLAPVNDPAYRPGRIATLVEFAERWQLEVLSQSKRSTINAAKSHLRTHILPMLGNSRLDQIGAEVQQAFVTKLSPKVARKALLNILGTLSAILTTAKEPIARRHRTTLSNIAKVGAKRPKSYPFEERTLVFIGQKARNNLGRTLYRR